MPSLDGFGVAVLDAVAQFGFVLGGGVAVGAAGFGRVVLSCSHRIDCRSVVCRRVGLTPAVVAHYEVGARGDWEVGLTVGLVLNVLGVGEDLAAAPPRPLLIINVRLFVSVL